MRSLKILFLLTLLAAAPLSASTVGHVVAFTGEGHIYPGGSEQAAVKVGPNSPVDLGDVLATGVDSKMQVLFEDDTVLTIGPETRLQIDESVYDPRQQRRVSKVRLLWGKVRSVVRKGWGRQHRYEVETDTAVVGVKGTEFVVVAPKPGEVRYGAGSGGECHTFVVVSGEVFVNPTQEELEGRAAGAMTRLDVCADQIFERQLTDQEMRDFLRDVIMDSFGEAGVAQFDTFGEAGWQNLVQIVRETFKEQDQQSQIINDLNTYIGDAVPSGPTGLPSGPTGLPSGPTGLPSGPTGLPSGPTGLPSGPTGLPSGPTGLPSGPTGLPSGPTGGPPTGMTGPVRGGGGGKPSGPGRGHTNPTMDYQPEGPSGEIPFPSFGDSIYTFPQVQETKPKRTTRPLQGPTRPRGRNSRR